MKKLGLGMKKKRNKPININWRSLFLGYAKDAKANNKLEELASVWDIDPVTLWGCLV
jgi:hypothetical protein